MSHISYAYKEITGTPTHSWQVLSNELNKLLEATGNGRTHQLPDLRDQTPTISNASNHADKPRDVSVDTLRYPMKPLDCLAP
jgi:hypothetical protein